MLQTGWTVDGLKNPADKDREFKVFREPHETQLDRPRAWVDVRQNIVGSRKKNIAIQQVDE